MQQNWLKPEYYTEEITKLLQFLHVQTVLVVCGSSFLRSKLREEMERIGSDNGIGISYFTDYKPNPDYESVIKGTAFLQAQRSEFLIAVGGGSAIDVAKSIKVCVNKERKKMKSEADIVMLAIPTTAGSGSESTQFAVVYQNGVKQSLAGTEYLPEYVLLLPSLLETLSSYQRSCTMMDTFSHGVESFWSLRSSEESREYSRQALALWREHREGYMANTKEGNKGMLLASNLAGRAINLAQTTAAHAMAYKLTSQYDLPHGHAVCLCLEVIWRYLLQHMEKCVDDRGLAYLQARMDELAFILKIPDAWSAVLFLKNEIKDRFFSVPSCENETVVIQLAESVNLLRLSNFPVAIEKSDVAQLYRTIFDRKRG